MKYLHAMVRVRDLDASLHFFRDALGLVETRRKDYPQGRFTLVFLAAPGDEFAQRGGLRIGHGAGRWAHRLRKKGEDAGIERVGLGQLPGRPGEVADLARIDDGHR